MESTFKIPVPMSDSPEKMNVDYDQYSLNGLYETDYSLSDIFPFDDFGDLYLYDLIRRVLYTEGLQLETSSAGEWDYSWVNFTLYKKNVYAGVVITESVPLEELFREILTTYRSGEKIIVENKLEYSNEEIIKFRSMYNVDINHLNKDAIGTWIKSLRQNKIALDFQFIIKTYVSNLISFLIKEPSYLHKIEWRDLERIIAETFTVFDCDVVLTRSSKDGGYDIYLQNDINGITTNYIVEIKHWNIKKIDLKEIRKLINISVKKCSNGIFLSTSGFNASIMEAIYDFNYNSILLGDKKIIYQLCDSYMRSKNGLWNFDKDLKNLNFLNKKG